MRVNIRTKLSLLWIVIMVNMIYNDIYSIMVIIARGDVPEIPGEVTLVMAIAAVLTNIPIFMILLSRLLPIKAAKILNICAGFFTIVYVVGGGDLAPHYIIVAAIEVALLIWIIISAWRWKEDK